MLVTYVYKSVPGNRVNIRNCVEQFVYSAGDLEFQYIVTIVSAILFLSSFCMQTTNLLSTDNIAF